MKTGGWIFMIASWSLIIIMIVYTYTLILSLPPKKPGRRKKR